MIRAIARRGTVTLMVPVVVVAGATGLVSYSYALPEDGLWISAVTVKRQVQTAMVRGTLHVVYSQPLRSAAPLATSKTETRLGPFYMRRVVFGNTIANGVGLPFWSICILAMIYPTVAYIRGPWCRWRRQNRNQCIHCGYRLGGLTEPRCPECGSEFEATPEPVATPAGTQNG